MMKRKWINILIFCTISICCNAQIEGYKFYALLDSIKTSGFYNIVLSSAINAHVKTDYSDVRIVNAEGKWIPHAIQKPNYGLGIKAKQWDLNYSIKKNNKRNTVLHIDVQNKKINNITLNIRNTAAERYCTLSGSDDNINWFVINDSILINPIPTETKTLNTFDINFPLSSYKFYKLVIINGNKDPLDVKGIFTSAKFFESIFTPNSSQQNPPTTILQKDSGKISYVKITQQQAFHFSQIKLKVSGPKYYLRLLEIFLPDSDNHSLSNPGHTLTSFSLSDNIDLDFDLPILNAKEFYIRIYNEDNLPLKVNEVATTISEHSLKTYLEKGESYRLIMGNSIAVQPNYDITKLNLTISDTATFIRPNNIIAFPQQEIKENKKRSNNKWIIWTALIVGLFILLLLTKKMIKEVNKKTTNDTI